MAEQFAVPTAPSGDSGGCGPLPTVLAHLVAVARTRMSDRGTVRVQPAGAGRYMITLCRGDRDLVMMFARRRREWVLTAAGMITGGQAQAVRCRTVAEAMRLLGGHDAEVGQPSSVRAARLPRDSALAANKNTVLRVSHGPAGGARLAPAAGVPPLPVRPERKPRYGGQGAGDQPTGTAARGADGMDPPPSPDPASRAARAHADAASG